MDAKYSALNDGDDSDSTPNQSPRPGDGLSPALLQPAAGAPRRRLPRSGLGTATRHHPLEAFSDDSEDENDSTSLHQPESHYSAPSIPPRGESPPALLAGHRPLSGATAADAKTAKIGHPAVNPTSHQYLVQLPDKSFATAVPDQLVPAFGAVRAQEQEFTQRTGSEAALDPSANELQAVLDDLAASHSLMPDNHPRLQGRNANSPATGPARSGPGGGPRVPADPRRMYPTDLFGLIYHLRRRRSLVFLVFIDTFYQAVLGVLFWSGSPLVGTDPASFFDYLMLGVNLFSDVTAIRSTLYNSVDGLAVAGILQIISLFIQTMSLFTPILLLRFFICILIVQVRLGTQMYEAPINELTRDMPTMFNL